MAFAIAGVKLTGLRANALCNRYSVLACARSPEAAEGDALLSSSVSRKRKRGRPKGSKNKPKKKDAQLHRETDNGAYIDVENGNGYEASFAKNFHLLLPLLSEPPIVSDDDAVDDDTRAMRDLVSTLSDRMVSTHRRVPQDGNLRPFSKREAALRVCATCSGRGEVRCGYCEGVGFMDLGENCEKFVDTFDGWTLAPPKRAVGSYFHCPLCGGRCKTRCETCFGTGTADGWYHPSDEDIADSNDAATTQNEHLSLDGASTAQPRAANAPAGKRSSGRPRYAARMGAGDCATEAFDLDAFLQEHRDRIEITADNLIILRAKKRRQRRPRAQSADSLPVQAPPPVAAAPLQPRRGRPRKGRTTDDDPTAPPRARRSGAQRRSTDFLNTTDFQVGRRLSASDPPERPPRDTA